MLFGSAGCRLCVRADCLPVPAITQRSQPAVELLVQLEDSHTPIKQPHRHARDCAVEHGTSVQANNDNSYNAQQVRKVEHVEVFPPNHRKAREEHGSHDQTRNNSREDKRRSPYAQS